MNDHQQNFYQTGSTHPPKSRRGLIAILLILAIFLGGLASGLGLVNIRLSRLLSSNQDTGSVQFSRVGASSTTETSTESVRIPRLGISCETVGAFVQNYYRLPQGVYVTQVTPESDAAAQGLVPGDLLLSLDGHPATNTDTLSALLDSYAPGDPTEAAIYRNGKRYTLTLTIGE